MAQVDALNVSIINRVDPTTHQNDECNGYQRVLSLLQAPRALIRFPKI